MPLKDVAARNKWQQDYQHRNREALTLEKKKRREAQRQVIREGKKIPCVDCYVQYDHWIMDYDHVRGVKRFNLNTLGRKSASWNTIYEEMAKCEVVCSNCHRNRTYLRSHGAKAEVAERIPNPLSSRFDSY